MTKILTTHAGSLIRPAGLRPYFEAMEARQPYDRLAFDAELGPAVADGGPTPAPPPHHH